MIVHALLALMFFSQNQTATSQVQVSVQPPVQTQQCGPPTYNCSRTDTAIVQTPAPPFTGLIGAGTVAIDPDFKNPMCRVTDASWGNNTFNAATSGSGDENHFNIDHSLMTVSDSGGQTLPVSFFFDGNTCKVGKLYVGSTKYPNGMVLPGTIEYSRKDNNVFYNYVASKLGSRIDEYNVFDRVNPPTAKVTVDFQSALVTASGVNPFVATWAANGGIVDQDKVFSMGFSNNGSQGGVGAIYVAVFVNGSGFRVLNTKTGEVTGTFGPVGFIPNWLAITNGAGFTIHNAKLSKDGDQTYSIITGTDSSCNVCGVYFWDVRTLSVGQQLPNKGGHWTSGRKNFVNGIDVSLIAVRAMANPSVVTVVNTKFPGAAPMMDSHFSWNNLSPNDTNPVIDATAWVDTPAKPVPALWAAAGYDEVKGFEMTAPPKLGKQWRFFHTFSTGKSLRFSTQNAIGSGSQDGWMYSVSSDMGGKLGSESGQPTCTLGLDCRGDVFVGMTR